MDNRDRILQAALTVFAEVGFRGATTRRIAQEAGVNEITLFRHFGSKDRLLHEAIRRSDLKPVFVAQLPDEPRRPRAELLAWCREHMQHLLKVRSLMCTCLAEMDAHPDIIPPRSPTTESIARLKVYFGKLRERGFTTATFDPDVVALALLGVLFADAMGRELMSEVYHKNLDRTLEGYVDFFLRGLGVDRPATGTRQERAS